MQGARSVLGIITLAGGRRLLILQRCDARRGRRWCSISEFWVPRWLLGSGCMLSGVTVTLPEGIGCSDISVLRRYSIPSHWLVGGGCLDISANADWCDDTRFRHAAWTYAGHGSGTVYRHTGRRRRLRGTILGTTMAVRQQQLCGQWCGNNSTTLRRYSIPPRWVVGGG